MGEVTFVLMEKYEKSLINERRVYMASKFIRVKEVAQELEVSEAYAYKIMKKLNDELEAKGFITVSGRLNRQYFNERLYGTTGNTEEKEGD